MTLRPLAVLFSLLFFSSITFAQTKITGKVTNDSGAPIAFANVYIKDSYDGASTDDKGVYSFSSDTKGDAVLIVSFVGYDTKETPVKLEGKPLTVDITIQAAASETRTVTISAGSFEASDEKKGVMLNSLDIVTTAGANGDIYGALNTLPGNSHVGEDEGLYVRGGDATEAKTIIDGMVVDKPFTANVPDIPSRGRFSPFEFKGTVFSTGGYSAEYGQALSSAIILNTEDFNKFTASSLSIMPIGVAGGHVQSWDKTSIGGYASYTNLTLYNWLYNSRVDFKTPAEAFGGSIFARQKTSETGLLKFAGDYSYSHLALYMPNLDDSTHQSTKLFALKNKNAYFNASYKEILSKKWSIFTGASYSDDINQIGIGKDSSVNQDDKLGQVKLKFTNIVNKNITLNFGGEFWKRDNSITFNQYPSSLQNLFSSGYAETNIYITDKLITQVGGRFEYASVISKYNIAPRVSVAYKTGKNSQVSFAYGDFYQTPENQYLYYQKNLDFEKATHFIANYQVLTGDRTFRIEGYWKIYDKLIKEFPDTMSFTGINYNNDGDGYARGFDIFWRDKKTFKNTDYWISYSFLDTKRNWLNYPIEAVPTFTSKNNLSIVLKYWIAKIHTSVSATYSYTSPRTYYNPNEPDNLFLSDKTKSLHDLSLSGSYLTQIKGNFTVVFVSIDNPIGFDNVYSYHYSPDGKYRTPVKSPFLRTVFVGVFISFNYGN